MRPQQRDRDIERCNCHREGPQVVKNGSLLYRSIYVCIWWVYENIYIYYMYHEMVSMYSCRVYQWYVYIILYLHTYEVRHCAKSIKIPTTKKMKKSISDVQYCSAIYLHLRKTAYRTKADPLNGDSLGRLGHWIDIDGSRVALRLTDFLRVEHSNIATCCTWATPKPIQNPRKRQKRLWPVIE